jgi:hypothetical protein
VSLSLARKASERQQARIKLENAANDPARTTMDQVLEAMDRQGHIGRIEAFPTPDERREAMELQKELTKEARAIRDFNLPWSGT